MLQKSPVTLPKSWKFEISQGEQLKKYCTLKVGGPAQWMAFPKTTVDLRHVIDFARSQSIPIEILGAGSNVLFSDKGFQGIIVCLKRFEEDHVFFRNDENELEVSAGISNYRLIRLAQKQNRGGFEFLAHVPGTIGGACRMNAGFSRHKGVTHEMSHILKEIVHMNWYGDLRTFTAESIEFSYRHSSIPPGIILFATLKTLPISADEIEAELRELELYRRKVQDVRYPSSGSMFKNPTGVPYTSGQLIDMAGLKGYMIGGAQISEIHGNFFINKGNATSADIQALVKLVKERILEQFNVALEMEVRYFD